MSRRLTVLVVLVGWAIAGGCRHDSSATSDPIPAEQLRETDVLPHLEGPIAGKNYVYCATFQLAWNRLQDDVFGEPIHLSGSPQMGEDLLRGSEMNEVMLPPGSYLIAAGLAKDDVVAKARAEMKQKFPNATLPIPDHLEDQGAIGFAYLQASFEFREAFDRLKEPLVFHTATGPVKVACFGIRTFEEKSNRDIALSEQISVLAYDGDDDFILRLNTTSKDDELIVAKIKPEKTLAETLVAVRARIERQGRADRQIGLSGGESLVIPIVDVNVERKYTELIGRTATNPKYLGLPLTVAEQAIRFWLDEKGARLESTADAGFASGESKRPAQYVFDKPFLIYLKRKSSDTPYLMIWIETAELLKKW